MSVLGTRVLRREDPALLCAGGTYVADVHDARLVGAAHVTFARAGVAHGTITSIDVSSALVMPGVAGVYTSRDVPLAPMPCAFDTVDQRVRRSPLADGVVRFVGEPVVAIVSETAAQGADAAESVVIDYDRLPVVVDPEEAARDQVVLHESAGTNVVMRLGDAIDEHLFDSCEVVLTERLVNRRVGVAPLEGRSIAAAWSKRLTVWLATQQPHGCRAQLAHVLGLEPDQVHVLTPDVGGGFGAKSRLLAEEFIVAWLARELGRPMRWTETRTENMSAMGHGRGQVQRVTIGGRRDGTIEAYRLEILADAGAYGGLGALLPTMTRLMASGPYDIARVEATSASVVTNTTPIVSYRGAGRPEATFAIERAVDLFAAEIGADPATVRRQNLVRRDRFPHRTPMGTVYDSGDYEGALDLALASAGYDTLRVEQQERRKRRVVVQLGVGVSVYVEITGGMAAGSEYAGMEMHSDGGITVYTGTSPHGQGHDTSWSMLTSDRLGVPLSTIEVIHGDTDRVPFGGGTAGSRSLQLGGAAVEKAAGELIDLARRRAAEMFEANAEDVVFDAARGNFYVAGTPSVSITWRDAAAAGELAVATRFHAGGPTFPFGAHVAVVEVDTETGLVLVRRVVTVDDAGTVINPLIVEGQRHGGLAQGIGHALCEEIVYDDDGNLLTSTFADFAVISACELPMFELLTMETPTPHNPLGCKGVGESGTIGATPAIQSAVVDALSMFGVRHVDIPMTPRNVWAAIHAASQPRPTVDP